MAAVDWDSECFEPHEKNFDWVRLKKGPPDTCWKLWKQLLLQLKSLYKKNGYGFWCNRRLLMCCANHLTVVIPKNAPHFVVGFFVAEKKEVLPGRILVSFFQSFIERRGYGRMMVDHLRKNDYQIVLDSPMPESIGFWERCKVRHDDMRLRSVGFKVRTYQDLLEVMRRRQRILSHMKIFTQDEKNRELLWDFLMSLGWPQFMQSISLSDLRVDCDHNPPNTLCITSAYCPIADCLHSADQSFVTVSIHSEDCRVDIDCTRCERSVKLWLNRTDRSQFLFLKKFWGWDDVWEGVLNGEYMEVCKRRDRVIRIIHKDESPSSDVTLRELSLNSLRDAMAVTKNKACVWECGRGDAPGYWRMVCVDMLWSDSEFRTRCVDGIQSIVSTALQSA